MSGEQLELNLEPSESRKAKELRSKIDAFNIGIDNAHPSGPVYPTYREDMRVIMRMFEDVYCLTKET